MQGTLASRPGTRLQLRHVCNGRRQRRQLVARYGQEGEAAQRAQRVPVAGRHPGRPVEGVVPALKREQGVGVDECEGKAVLNVSAEAGSDARLRGPWHALHGAAGPAAAVIEAPPHSQVEDAEVCEGADLQCKAAGWVHD